MTTSKGTKAMKLGQLIEYIIKKRKIEIEHVSGSPVLNVAKFFSIVYPNQGLLKYIKIKVLGTCFYLV